MAFEVTTALEKIRALESRVSVIQGGTSASKTISVLLIIANYAIENSGKVVTVVSDTFPNLRTGAMRDWLKICKETNIDQVAVWNKAESTMTFPNGTLVEFKSVDTMGALGARRDMLYVNEANRIAFETYKNLEIRTREKIYLDFNPVNEFWAHKELVGKDDVDFIKLTYLDNEALDENTRKAIEAEAPAPGEKPSNWYLVYGLGEIGSLEGNIYSGWMKHEKPARSRLVRYGLDFGFSNDETAMVEVWEVPDGGVWIKQVIYEKGLLGSQYGAKLEAAGVDPSVLIIADSARPEIIAEIKHAGFRCVGADKSAGSVKRGIDRVCQRKVLYDHYSKDLEREYLTYAWRKKKGSGETIDEPQDGNDHLMDALRYAIDDLSRQRFDF